MNGPSVYESHLKSLPLIGRGKVRDNYAVGSDMILMVATDRISAFDVIMADPIPGKGITLTRLALFWFKLLEHVVPNHLTDLSPEAVVDITERDQVKERSMVVKRLRPIQFEAVVRGYLAGSAWSEYQSTKTICGNLLVSGLRRAEKLPEVMFTPATKAESGQHDVNVSFDYMCNAIGADLGCRIRDISIELYQQAAAFAISRGLIIADTKFEFGLDDDDQIVLMDEILTPDSSRFWPLDKYCVGVNPPSFDKQFLRDWLERPMSDGTQWNKRAPPPKLPDEVLRITQERYAEAADLLLK